MIQGKEGKATWKISWEMVGLSICGFADSMRSLANERNDDAAERLPLPVIRPGYLLRLVVVVAPGYSTQKTFLSCATYGHTDPYLLREMKSGTS